MASLGAFVAGRYSATWNAGALGSTREGYTTGFTPDQEVINQSDQWGGSTVDWILRGGNMTIDFIVKEYLAGVLATLWPWNATRGILSNSTSPLGRLASSIAQSMVLTATANTPAAAAPATHTGAAALLAPNFEVRTLFDSRLREIPLKLQYLPYVSGGNTIWFVET